MQATPLIDPARLDQILRECIAEECQVVLTHQSAAGWRLFKSVFRSGSRGSQLITVVAKIPADMADASLPRRGDSLGVTFRRGHKKYLFVTTVGALERNGDKGVVGLHWPDNIQQLQRRVYERAKPPRHAAIAVRLWHEDARGGGSPESRLVRHGQLENLSAGGMQVKVADSTDFVPGTTFRCIFTPRHGKPSIIVEALVRHREAADGGRASIGFQFLGLEASPEGHNVLDRLVRTVSEFQRARSRKHEE